MLFKATVCQDIISSYRQSKADHGLALPWIWIDRIEFGAVASVVGAPAFQEEDDSGGSEPSEPFGDRRGTKLQARCERVSGSTAEAKGATPRCCQVRLLVTKCCRPLLCVASCRGSVVPSVYPSRHRPAGRDGLCGFHVRSDWRGAGAALGRRKS